MIVFTSCPSALQRLGLELGVLDDAAPEGPRVRNDDADLHRGHYRRRAVRLRSPYDREILRLALPALGALAAEPLYVLVDTAIVGHLGRPQLAALGLAGTVLAGAFTIFNFLTYGTTAVVARASGAGQHERAARLAAQALWVVARDRGRRSLVVLRGGGRAAPPRRSARTAAPATSRSSTSASARSACRRRSSRSPGRATCAASRTCAARS